MCSPESGWKKAFSAYSPSTNILHSPVIQTEGKLYPSITSDITLVTVSWALNIKEEYYYQNFIELMSLKKKDIDLINKILRINRIPAYWPDRFVKLHELGKGCFGVVYKAADKYTGVNYAVKEITSYTHHENQFLSNTVSIMTERGAFLRSNESPFVVKMHGAFQDNNLRSYWLVFEFCIGELKTYLKFIKGEMIIFLDKMLTTNVIAEFYRVYNEKLGLDIEGIGCILGFELLAGLAYLSNRNLLHNDLKPDNILIAQTGHAKISDLGLTQRIKWLDRRSGAQLVQPNELKDIQISDLKQPRVGNTAYTDPETLIYYGVIMKPADFYEEFQHSNFPINNGEQNFLTDLYGVALIFMDLLFFSMNVIISRNISIQVKKRFKLLSRDIDTDLFSIRCIYDPDVHKNYLMKILYSQYTDNNKSIMDFLVSCFKPRMSRALHYTREIEIRQMKKNYLSRCIDINKIENIEYYRIRNITQYNVCNYKISDIFMTLYTKPNSDIEAETFEQLLSRKKPRKNTCEREMRITAFDLAI